MPYYDQGAVLVFKTEFYSTCCGDSPVLVFLEELQLSCQDHQIQYRQLVRAINYLELKGTFIGEPHTKHLEDNIWELRPGCNRVLYFFFRENTFVLLHAFRKRTNKTPCSEILKAKVEREDWISRHP